MKKIVTFILIFTSLLAFAAPDSSALWQDASKQYADQNYEAALKSYEQLIPLGTSPELYYNYANTLYKTGQISASILNYERCLRLDPKHEDAQNNLNFLNHQISDKITPIQPFFMKTWLTNFGRLMPSNSWAYLCLGALMAMVLLFLLFLFGKSSLRRRISFFTAVLAFFIMVISCSYAFVQKSYETSHHEAIVMVGSVTVNSTPDDSGTDLFVIHEGTKVRIKSTMSSWTEISLSDGRIGWLPSSNIEKI